MEIREPSGRTWTVKRQLVAAKVPQHGIDGISEILSRVDQRTVEVEDQQSQLARWNFTIDFHSSVYLRRSY